MMAVIIEKLPILMSLAAIGLSVCSIRRSMRTKREADRRWEEFWEKERAEMDAEDARMDAEIEGRSDLRETLNGWNP